MAYTKVNWKNLPDKTTPLTAANLNHMDDKIADLDSSVNEVSAQLTALKGVPITTAAFSSLPYTYPNTKIRSNHKVAQAVLSNPSAQTGEWTVTTSNGSLTISGSISGSTNVEFLLVQT